MSDDPDSVKYWQEPELECRFCGGRKSFGFDSGIGIYYRCDCTVQRCIDCHRPATGCCYLVRCRECGSEILQCESHKCAVCHAIRDKREFKERPVWRRWMWLVCVNWRFREWITANLKRRFHVE